MIIRFFKSDQPASLVLLPLAAIPAWIFTFSKDTSLYTAHVMPFFEPIGRLGSEYPTAALIMALAALIAGAFLINFLVLRHELTSRPGYLPALLYLVFMSAGPGLTCLHPLLFANLFIIIALHKVLNTYRKDRAFSEAFDAGFYISIASLFYFPAILLILLVGISFLVIRPFIWREWVIAAMGLTVPYLFAGTYYYCFDISEYLWYDKIIYPISVSSFKMQETAAGLLPYAVILGIVFLSFLGLFLSQGVRKHKTKNVYSVLAWMLVVSVLTLVAAPGIRWPFFSFAIIPFAVFASNYFITVKRAWWPETLFILLLAAIIYSHLRAI